MTPTHFNPINDSVFSGVFLIRGMRSAAGRTDALSCWVASDHFEELGRPPRLLHGGFGLQTVGNLPKPRFHAMHLLSKLGEQEMTVDAAGDGAGSLVESWASRARDGRIAILLWSLTLDQSKATGDDLGVGDWPADEVEWDKIAEASKLHMTESTATAHGSLDVERMIDMPSTVLVELLPS